jgi:hypothetical protein
MYIRVLLKICENTTFSFSNNLQIAIHLFEHSRGTFSTKYRHARNILFLQETTDDEDKSSIQFAV